MNLHKNPNRISKYFKLPALGQTARDSYLSQLDNHYNAHNIKMHNNAYIFGIEVELENNTNPRTDGFMESYWNVVNDGSLRNNGTEYVSLPIRANQIESALTQLQVYVRDPSFSDRTSVHIHMNVRDMTIEQIQSLILIYASVENLLFNWVGHNREDNIFCTKLEDTDYYTKIAQFSQSPGKACEYWEKYTALNIKPISSKGTVEFRHLYGTYDIQTICTWVNLLSCLKTYAKYVSLQQLLEELEQLNSNSLYEIYLGNIFGEYAQMFMRMDINKVMKDTISFIKCSCHYFNTYLQDKTSIKIEPPQYIRARRDIERVDLTMDFDVAAELERARRDQEIMNQQMVTPTTTRNTLNITHPTQGA